MGETRMNGKKAKSFRRLAQHATQGYPEKEYTNTRTVVLIKACTRYVYKRLKRIYKRGSYL